ncbi:MAG: histidine triad nucleotide-binding protein [Candidatus Sericytochromatia bacterium]
MSETTIFDKILAGQIPADKVYEDEDILAFRDVNPQAPVHVLVIPKARVSRFALLPGQDPATVGKLFQGAARVARELGLDADGYRVVVNNGEHGQQTVEYIHLHILGGRQMNWPPG